MLVSRSYWKLFSSYAVLVVLTSAVLGTLAYNRFQRTLHRSVEVNLQDQLNALSVMGQEIFLNPLKDKLDVRLKEIGRRTHSRLTAILPDGRVLYDSEANPAVMENHANRPEVVRALQGEIPIVQRHSVSVDKDLLYSAVTVRRGSELLGVLRAAVSVETEKIQLAEMFRNLLYGAMAGIVVALILGAWVASRITTPLQEMRVVAESMRLGEYHRRVTRLPNNEIGLLGDTLNRLGSELTIKISNLAHEEAQLRAILAGMVEGVIAVDSSDTILYHNRAAAKLLGRGEDGGLSGKKIWQFTDLRELREVVDQVRDNDSVVQKEIHLSLDGGKRVLNLHAALFESSVSKGAILVLHDITELRHLERVRRDFVANVSHELKTPLTSIKGYVETLQEGALHDDKHNMRFLEKISKHVGHLTDLVQDLLALGEIESESRKLVVESVDWNRAIDEVVGRYELEFSRKRLTCRKEDGPSVRVLGDGHAMFQIASNLVSNAVKYTPEDGTIMVRTYEKDGFGCFEVVDTGLGIPEKDLPRVFERFYRVDKARSREVGGTGLGLAIVKHLVQAMSGEIRVESRVGGGSKFTVRLPLSPPTA